MTVQFLIIGGDAPNYKTLKQFLKTQTLVQTILQMHQSNYKDGLVYNLVGHREGSADVSGTVSKGNKTVIYD